MRKVVLAILTVTITTFSVLGQDFRNATWGMSPSQVKSIEEGEFYKETPDALAYETTLAGYDAMAIYFFIDGKLSRARYALYITHFNNNDFVSDYEGLNNRLEMKYGEPMETEMLWQTDSPFKKDKSMWGYSVAQGDLVMYSIYAGSSTAIVIGLSAEDYDPSIVIEYFSMNEELFKSELEKMIEDF